MRDVRRQRARVDVPMRKLGAFLLGFATCEALGAVWYGAIFGMSEPVVGAHFFTVVLVGTAGGLVLSFPPSKATK